MAHYGGRRGCEWMVVVFTTTDAISIYHYWCSEFESRSGRGVQHYVIKFVSDLWKAGGFPQVLRSPPTNKTGRHGIAEILLKVALNTSHKQTNNMCDEILLCFKNERSKQFHVSPLLFSLFVIRMSNTEEHTSDFFLWNTNGYSNLVLSKHMESIGYHYNLPLIIPHVRSL